MADKNRAFVRALGEQSSLTAPSLYQLLRQVKSGGGAKALRDLLSHLNDELCRTLWVERAGKAIWAREILTGLLHANQQLTIETLKDLLDSIRLDFRDPLMEVVFETASEVKPLKSVLASIVWKEKGLLQLRERALETILTRSSAGKLPHWEESESEGVLRFLNTLLDRLEKGSRSESKKWSRDFSEKLKVINRLCSKMHAQRSDGALSLRDYRRLLQLLQEAFLKLASAPASMRAIQAVLRILQVNIPLPSWHPASVPLAMRLVMARKGGGKPPTIGRTTGKEHHLSLASGLTEVGWHVGPAGDSRRDDTDATETVVALILDKTIEVVFAIASTGWAEEHRLERNGRWPVKSLNPSSLNALESVLIDQKYPAKIRRTAAALVRVLSYPFPSARLSSRVEFYADLFLTPSPSGSMLRPHAYEGRGTVDTQEKIPFLFDALEEKSDYARRNAAAACYQAAQDHPEWFQPKHYTKLLPLLADEHHGTRLDIMRTFRGLASSRNQKTSDVIQDISTRVSETFHGKGMRPDVESALGMTLDTLLERVDELQGDVERFEERRRQLLGHMEKQAMRIGEEIHHEILNTLCAYLATAIDERDYAGAKGQLGELVTDLRRIMNNLYPKDLETEGFLVTIRKRLADAKAQMQRKVPESTVEFECPAEITDEAIAECLGDKLHVVLLYRIVLEAIINARKHAQGTFIGIKVRRSPAGAIVVTVIDNGRGNGGPFEEHVGVGLMLRRAEEIGADIEYKKTSPLGGTKVVIRLPQAQRSHGLDECEAMETRPYDNGV